jgi:hypothetical protein
MSSRNGVSRAGSLVPPSSSFEEGVPPAPAAPPLLQDPSVRQLQAEDKDLAALNYLARRGSEAERTSDEEFDEEAMTNVQGRR